MPTVVTDKTDKASVEELLGQFKSDEQVDVYASELNADVLERTIVLNKLSISEVFVQPQHERILFILSSGVVIERKFEDIGLSGISESKVLNYENMGDGIMWPDIPSADLCLRYLLKEELWLRYNMEVA